MKNKQGIYAEPVSISRFDRNDRIFKTLLGMGLVVVPMFTDKEHHSIDHFIVSSGMPRVLRDQQDQG